LCPAGSNLSFSLSTLPAKQNERRTLFLFFDGAEKMISHGVYAPFPGFGDARNNKKLMEKNSVLIYSISTFEYRRYLDYRGQRY
jgi:hypothetical protein